MAWIRHEEAQNCKRRKKKRTLKLQSVWYNCFVHKRPGLELCCPRLAIDGDQFPMPFFILDKHSSDGKTPWKASSCQNSLLSCRKISNLLADTLGLNLLLYQYLLFNCCYTCFVYSGNSPLFIIFGNEQHPFCDQSSHNPPVIWLPHPFPLMKKPQIFPIFLILTSSQNRRYPFLSRSLNCSLL